MFEIGLSYSYDVQFMSCLPYISAKLIYFLSLLIWCISQFYTARNFLAQKLPKDCPKGCPFIYKPVCGSDGITYSNICVMRSDACEMGKEITVRKEGACGK